MKLLLLRTDKKERKLIRIGGISESKYRTWTNNCYAQIRDLKNTR